jgi:S1-C subfamily serine protease
LFSVKELLSQTLGVEVSFTGNGWKVLSVRQGGSAERSGIMSNDIIEAVDGIKLLSETIRTNSINGKKISINRSGQRLEIDLR